MFDVKYFSKINLSQIQLIIIDKRIDYSCIIFEDSLANNCITYWLLFLKANTVILGTVSFIKYRNINNIEE